MFFAVNGARFGFFSTALAKVGYSIATWAATVAIGLGFSTSLDKFSQIFVALKVSEALYVLMIT